MVTQGGNRRHAAIKECGQVLEHLPGKGESLHVIFTGRFDLCDFLEVIFSKMGPVDHLHSSTLSFSARNVAVLANWLELGLVKRLTLLWSLFFERHNPEVVKQMRDLLQDKPGHRTATARTHAKIFALEFASGRRWAIESSANWRSNSNIENATIFDNPALCKYHASLIDAMVTKYEAAGKVKGNVPAKE